MGPSIDLRGYDTEQRQILTLKFQWVTVTIKNLPCNVGWQNEWKYLWNNVT